MKKLETTTPEYLALSNYAKKLLKQWTITLLIIIIAALLAGVLKEAIVIILVFAPMRKFAGGYHMKKFNRCLISSTVMLVSGAMIAKYNGYSEKTILYNLALMISVIVFLSMKPIAVKRNGTSEEELNKYRIIVKSVLLMLLVIIIILSHTKFQTLTSSICIGIVECSSVFLLGKIEHIIQMRNHEREGYLSNESEHEINV